MSIYSELILDHSEHPSNYGRPKGTVKSVSVNNPLCGDTIEMYVRTGGGKVTEIGFESRGCVISRASASMLTEKARGTQVVELKKIDRESIIKMLGIELGVNRIKCAMLPLEALRKLI